ncbi:Mobile element protein [Methanosarcina sp. Kolksee]|nr:Mobile element protein [Methanosarcina sp. Kolksee]
MDFYVDLPKVGAYIRRRVEENIRIKEMPGYRTRRWVVERTHSWLNRFRRLLIRWEKKVNPAFGR